MSAGKETPQVAYRRTRETRSLIADMNGDGYDDLIAVEPNSGTAPTNLLKWYVHYWDPNGAPAQQGGGTTDYFTAARFSFRRKPLPAKRRGGTTDYFSDGVLAADAEFSFGFNIVEPTVSVDDIPLVGDFNGDGRANVAVARDNGAVYDYFIAYASGGANPYPNSVLSTLSVNQTFAFGQSGSIPVVGDWDNDGDDNIGVIREGFGAGGSSEWLLGRAAAINLPAARLLGFDDNIIFSQCLGAF